MYRRYGDRVAFLAVYVREAHPSDGWGAASAVKQPRTAEERCEVAATCRGALKMTMSLVIDDQEDHVGHAYSGMPDRLYVIDRAGKVAYQGGRGPFEFKPGQMEQALIMLLLDEAAQPTSNLTMPAGCNPWAYGGPEPFSHAVRIASIRARLAPRSEYPARDAERKWMTWFSESSMNSTSSTKRNSKLVNSACR